MKNISIVHPIDGRIFYDVPENHVGTWLKQGWKLVQPENTEENDETTQEV